MTIHDHILTALRALANACDGATTRDKKGFSGADSAYGKELAAKERLGRWQLMDAHGLLQKYRKQLSEKHGIELCEMHEVAQVMLDSVREKPELPKKKPETENAVERLWSDADRIAENFNSPIALPPSDDYEPVHATVIDGPHWVEGDEILPGIYATGDQAAALNALWAWYKSPEPEFLLLGYAGTGKSLLLHAFLKALRDWNLPCNTVLTASTNKATDVLSRMVSAWGLGLECKTAASLKGLQPKRDYKTGAEYFVQSFDTRRPSAYYSLLCVDEVSMVGGDVEILDRDGSPKTIPGLFTVIQDGIGNETIPGTTTYSKAIYVGDTGQVPPVGQKCSPAFMAVKNKAVLTQVKRYTGPILEFATQLRNNLNDPNDPEMVSDPDGGLYFLPRPTFDKWLKAAAQRNAFDHGITRALAWTNKRVDAMSSSIREQIYGVDAGQIVTGELIVVGKPYAHFYDDCNGREKSEVILKTSQEFVVSHVKPGTLKVDAIDTPMLGIGPDDSSWDVLWVEFDHPPFTIVIKDVFGDLHSKTIDCFPVLRDHEEKRLSAVLAKLKKSAQWKQYYRLRDSFADLRSALSLTVHKGQGSTFDTVFVDYRDIKRCKDKGLYYDPDTDTLKECYEWRRLLYTAATRPQTKLVVGL